MEVADTAVFCAEPSPVGISEACSEHADQIGPLNCVSGRTISLRNLIWLGHEIDTSQLNSVKVVAVIGTNRK